ncbi:MAG: cell division protein FtsA, partial [Candidatus Krumholzibacteriota bacterium]|nr:cell division protein FtsA [Candidatus Krumholzibacteriota bacterium]
RSARARAGKMAGVEIQGVCAGISGPHIRSINSRGMVTIPESRGEITSEDVSRVIEAAGNITLPAEMEVLQNIPQDFMVDKQRGIQAPRGMTARKLGAEVHIVTAQSVQVENLIKVIEITGLEVMNVVFEPLAASLAVLNEEEKETGCLVIDMGGGVTSYALYYGGSTRGSGVIAAGGTNITNDLAIGLRVPYSIAERIKLEHGLALTSLARESDTVIVPGAQENGGREIRREIIAAIIEPRCEEIFSMIKTEISPEPYYRMIGGGVVLTGGGSKIRGMESVAGQVFDMPVRSGRPQGLDGLSEIVCDECWSAGVGLLHYEAGRLLSEKAARRNRGSYWWMLNGIKKIASMF